jgi:hypothetical protein
MAARASLPAIALVAAGTEPETGGLLESLWSDRQLAGTGAVLESGEETLLAMAQSAQPAPKLSDPGLRRQVGSVGSAKAPRGGTALSTSDGKLE